MIRWSDTSTIIRREYLARVRTRAFWASTILVPVFMGSVMVLPGLLATRQKGNLVLGLEDQTGRISAPFAQNLAAEDNGRLAQRIQVVTIPAGTPNDAMAGMVRDGKIDGFVVITEDNVKTGEITYRASVTTNIMLQSDLENLLSEVISADRLKSRGLDASVVRELSKPVKLQAVDISGEEKGSSMMRFGIAYGMFAILYFVLIFYGQNVMSGVLEEKTSRIVEVIVSSVRPTELMMGKLIGIGSAGLTQILIWMVAASLFAGGPAAGMLPANVHIPAIPAVLVAHLIFYFITGFFLYATLYALLGAMNNSEQEARQMIMLVTLPLIIPAVLVMTVINDPNSALAVGLSIFPLFSPLLMMARIAVGAAKPVEIAVADVLLIATIFLEVLLAARIYRVAILMYGKRPTIPEMLRWARYR